MITGDPKMPHFAFKLSPTYRITRVTVVEALGQDYYRLESGGVVHGAEIHLSVKDAVVQGRQKIRALEIAVAKTQQKINERKAALKNAETMAKAY